MLTDAVLNRGSSRRQRVSSRPGHWKQSHTHFRSAMGRTMENEEDTNPALSSDNSMKDGDPDLPSTTSARSSSLLSDHSKLGTLARPSSRPVQPIGFKVSEPRLVSVVFLFAVGLPSRRSTLRDTSWMEVLRALSIRHSSLMMSLLLPELCLDLCGAFPSLTAPLSEGVRWVFTYEMCIAFHTLSITHNRTFELSHLELEKGQHGHGFHG